MLRPADPAKGNSRIIYDVTNRGRKFFHFGSWTACRQRPEDAAGRGQRDLPGMGYTIVWSGWDPDAPRPATAWR